MESIENEQTYFHYEVENDMVHSHIGNLEILENVHSHCNMEDNNNNVKKPVTHKPIVEGINLLENNIDEAILNGALPGRALQFPQLKPIDYSNDGTKSYSCYFCKKNMKGKITDHWFSVHKEQPQVKEILALPPASRIKGHQLTDSQRLRQKMIDKLRKEGNFNKIMNASLTDTCTTVRRSRKNKQKKNLSDYRLCSGCHGFYIKSSIRKHISQCLGLQKNTGHQTLAVHNLIVGNIHPRASIYLRKVACRLSNDEISEVAKKDLLIILHGNLEAFKFRHSNHHNKQIRAQMRLLARLLMELKTKNTDIANLSSLFDPKYISLYFEVVNKLGKFNLEKDLFDAPATARDIGLLTTAVCNVWLGECIEAHQDKNESLANKFLHLFNLRFPKLIVKTVSESQTHIEISKRLPILPSLKDIKAFHNYLTIKREKAFKFLTKKFDFHIWKQLVETTLISIQLLNRRRPGELERMKTELYKNSFEQITEKTCPDLYKKLSSTAKMMANKYSRILLRGKKNAKIVPVLLSKEIQDCIDIILHYREDANVPLNNPYIFGLPNSQGETNWVRACPVMKKFSEEASVGFPHTLRGTLLRKHIATVGMALNLTDGEVDDLSKFMGHDKPIHLKIYRQPVGTRDILHVSQWLEKAQGSYQEDDNGGFVYAEDSSDNEDTSTPISLGNQFFAKNEDSGK